VVRPGGLELPTFWFVGRFRTTRQHTPAENSQWNQRKQASALGPFRLALYPVHGQSHGQFRAEHALGKFCQFGVLVKVLNLMTSLISMCVAKEGYSIEEMHKSASENPRSLALNASTVVQRLILGGLFTELHSPIVRDEPRLREPANFRPGRFFTLRNQCRLDDDFAPVLARSCRRFPASPSDCLPDVPQQLFHSVTVAGDCPRSVRVFEARQHAG